MNTASRIGQGAHPRPASRYAEQGKKRVDDALEGRDKEVLLEVTLFLLDKMAGIQKTSFVSSPWLS
jgi:hypothetical protein